MAIRIITDSTCDIPIRDCEKMGIDLVPLKVTIDGKTYLDKYELTNEEFYIKLAKAEETPVTTLASPQAFLEAFEKYEEDIICITVSSKLSGTYQSAVIAKEELGRDNIHVIDSNSVTIGAALLIEMAVKMADEGANAAEIADKLRELAPQVEIYAVVDTLKYLVKGGRLSKASGAIGTMLGIKPILRVRNGVIENIAKERGTAKALCKMVSVIRENTDYAENGCGITYGNADNHEGMESVMEMLGKSGRSYSIGSVVGTHAGPGAVGIAVINRKG